ncbi:MAG: MFS transporter [Ignavibacteriaceae bacterium]|nr:MFS transporter [Ignavibacteriaceae bacterium]
MELTADVIKREPSKIFRWLILLFVSLAMFGNYYVYDSISPLADLLSKQLHFHDSDIGILNAIYSIPNVFMVLIGGIIIDKFGTRISSFVFALLCLLGASLTAVSGTLTFMAAGRLIFGLGAESLIVAVTTIMGKWFKGKELSFAFGLNLTLARLGSFAALNSPSWGKAFYNNWQIPLVVAASIATISVLSVIVYWGMDVYASKKFILGDVAKQDEVHFKEIFSFSKSYWFVVMLCVTFYSAIFPFQTFAVKFFMEVHGTTREFGGFLSSMLTLSAMILTPLFGLFVDYYGKRSLLMMIGSLILVPVYLLMAYTKVSLFVPMAMMGLSFSLIPAVMWPSVTIIVEESKLGTAYGLMTMIQNIGLAGFNLLIGWANDFSGGYTMGMWIFSILGFSGMLFSFLLRRSELGPKGHGLEKGFSKSA